ncbi:DMT family transporter [Bosea sp. (in: a-proteobacteria)]|uniref:DMT family transporter n=1 Tax=Bosea sp. (in: a-proteobacteria) TaxID=1871050 RepID=UPI0025C0AFCA|nr:DMT family transporter [Bosea sp. (in: a-proteobacteria)]
MSAAPAPHPDTRRTRLTAILLMCAAVLCFALLDASAKWLGGSMHAMQVVAARYLISVALVSTLLNPWSRPGILRTRRPWLQGFRSLLLLTSTGLNFIALKYLQLAESVSIMFATPFLVALLAGPILGEWAGPRRLAAIGVGFIGVLIILRPGFGGLPPAALLTVCGCFCYAFYSISTRMLAASDAPETTMFYSGIVGAVVMLPLVPLFWSWPADGASWLLMLSVGLFGALGHWLLILAHQRAPASMLSPFNYSQIVWMVALGWFVFGQIPDGYTFIGASIVIGSGLYLLYRERVRAVPEGSARLD